MFVCNVAWFFVSHRLVVARAAVEAGYRVVVCAAEDDSAHRIREAGCEFVAWAVKRGSVNLVGELGALATLRRIVRRLEPDVLHLVTPKPIFYGGVIGRILGVRAVVLAVSGQGFVSSDGGALASGLKLANRAAYRFILSHPGVHVIVQNRNDADYFSNRLGLNPSRITLTRGSGVDLDRFRPGPESDPPIVLLAARMIWPKGIGEFVEAARRVRASGIRARFVLAGGVDEHNPRAVPERVLAGWRDGDTVEWLGHVDRTEDLIRTSAVVCLPTTYGEGIPKVLLEAAACAKPVVTTRWAGCDEVVSDGVTGYLCAPGDVDELTDRLRRLLLDPSLRRRFGSAGRETARREFSDEQVVDQTLGIYASARLSGRARDDRRASRPE